MFEQENFAALQASAKVMQDTYNANLEFNYLRDARNWAENHGVGPAPVAPRKQSITADRATYNLISVALSEPVSTVDPGSLLPRFATDIGAIGGRVGGPIEGQPGKFYLQSGAKAMHGDRETANGSEFEFRAPFFGLGGYWVAR